MSRLSLTLLPSNYRVCEVCGQTHEDGTNHVFDYPDEVDEDLQCKVCRQPLVDPYDTPCCHTFCKICISKHLRQESRCPIDNSSVTMETIRQSSLLVRKILDKLQVVCPNNGYCDLIMQRSVLEQHLGVQCPGSYVECPQKDKGCEYNGPRFNLEDHLWTCGYASDRSRDGTPLPIVEEQVTLIEIPKGTCDLGLKLKSPGNSAAENGVLVEEIFPGGNAAKDGRLRPGDIIMKVNDTEVSAKSLARAALALGSPVPIVRLTVFRPTGADNDYVEIEVIEIKRPLGQTLGLRIMARKHQEGVFVLGVQAGSSAEQTHRLCKGDRILEINGVDTKWATVDVVAQLLLEANENVRLVVGRMQGSVTSRSELCSAMNSTSSPVSSNNQYDLPRVAPVNVGEEKNVHIRKDPGESFGMSIAGGLQSECGDLPIFITNVIIDGPVGRTRKVKKGDILLSMNNIDLVHKTHTEAVQIIKAWSGAMDVSVEFVKLILFETGRYEVNLTFDDISKSTTLYIEGNVQLANLPKFQFSVTDQGHNGTSFHRKMRVRLSLLDRNSSQPVLYGEGETFFCLPESPSNPFYSPTVEVRSAIGRINKVVSTPCNVVQMILTVPSQNIMALKKYRGRAWLRLNTPFDTPSVQHHPVGMNADDISVEDNPQLQWAGLPPRDIQTPSSDESYTPTHSPQLADVNQPSPSNRTPSNRSPSPPSNHSPSPQSNRSPSPPNHSPSPQSNRSPSPPNHSPSPQSNRSPSAPSDHSRLPSSQRPAPPHSQHQAVELNLTDTPTVNPQDTPSANNFTLTSPHPQTQLKCESCSSRVQNTVSCAVQTEQDWVKSYCDRRTVDSANSGEQCGFGDGVAASTDTDLPSLRTVVTSLLGDHRFEREGVSAPVRGVSLSTDHNSDVLRVLAMELKGYREVNTRLGQEIHSLKREERELREQVEFYKSMAVPKVADQFLGKNDSEIANQLSSLTKGDLYLKSLELHGQCRTLSQQVVAYREKVVFLQNRLIAQNDHEEDLLQLQKAHTEQQQIVLDLQDKTERLKKFKETCQLQESVITKLEDLVTSQTRGYGSDTSCAVQRTLADENKRLRELVTRLESQIPLSGPHTAHTNTHSPRRVEYLDQMKRISSQCDNLEQRLKQVTVERDSPQTSSHLLQLEQKLILVSSELEAVKEELQANVSTWAKEKTQYEVTISQQEARLKQLEVHRN